MNLFSFLAEILFIGHSLIGPDLPVLVDGGLRQMREPATVAAQIINGAPLKFNRENSAGAEGVDGAVELAKGETRVLVLAEAVPLAQHIQWNDTAGQVAAFYGQSPGGRMKRDEFIKEGCNELERCTGVGCILGETRSAGIGRRPRTGPRGRP